ncbi:MAG: phage virion morphogenesis protein [Bacteroidales bacterium]|jgi:phage gpG-like protein|nr:phage virion morphogenesis protein [Bacteroidales bacterium]
MGKSYMALLDDVAKAIDKLPAKVATAAVNFSKSRFVKQNWHDQSPEPWEKRRRDRRGGKKRQKGAVLVDSGRLKRSIRIVSISRERVVTGTDVPYARIHNDGLDGAVQVRKHNRRSRKGNVYGVKAHTRKVKMPRRRFLGDSAELARQLENLMADEIKNAIEN